MIKFPDIEKAVGRGEPVYLTKNGYGAMVVLSLEAYSRLTDGVEAALDEADRYASENDRDIHKKVWLLCEVYSISADYLIRDDYEKEDDIPVIKRKNEEIIEVRKKNSNLLLFSAIMFVVVSFCALMSLITAQSDMQVIMV